MNVFWLVPKQVEVPPQDDDSSRPLKADHLLKNVHIFVVSALVAEQRQHCSTSNDPIPKVVVLNARRYERMTAVELS